MPTYDFWYHDPSGDGQHRTINVSTGDGVSEEVLGHFNRHFEKEPAEIMDVPAGRWKFMKSSYNNKTYVIVRTGHSTFRIELHKPS